MSKINQIIDNIVLGNLTIAREGLRKLNKVELINLLEEYALLYGQDKPLIELIGRVKVLL